MNVLGSRRCQEQRFRLSIHPAVIRIQQDRSDLVADSCTARLPGDDDPVTVTHQRICEQLDLGRLPRSVRTFKCDEYSTMMMQVSGHPFMRSQPAPYDPNLAQAGIGTALKARPLACHQLQDMNQLFR